nr:hypothetical protein [Prevotella sp.]
GDESRAETLTSDKRGADFIFDDLDDSVGSYVVYYPDKTVTIPTVQTQSGADNTDHIGRSGDCGTATATRQQDGTYSFTLDHKAAYLCFLPHINHLPSVKIKKIEVSCSGNIAGTYSLSKSGLYNGKNTSNKIVLNLNTKKDKDFFLGHDYHSEQDSCAAYMVIAPCGSQTFVASYYVTDTLSRMDKLLRQTFTLNPQPNTVYPVEFNIRDLEFRAVDMGLSVNWSNVNVNAPVPTSHGTYYDNDADANAALLSQTTVTEWLMPDADQREELLEKCQWEWVSYDGVNGYLVTAPSAARDDGNVHRLFIPSKSNTQVTPEAALSAVCRPIEALMIDLGLPSGVKWASRNVGANSVEDYGNYYAWGETETKDSYTSGTYKYGTRNLGNNLDIGGTQNDAATLYMGNAWRMPTITEWHELNDNCTWTWSSVNGINGFIITGINGNRIFLPASGARKDNGISFTGSGASYPSSNQGGDNSSYAWTVTWSTGEGGGARYFANNDNYYPLHHYNYRSDRYIGRTIRAVAPTMTTSTDGIGYKINTDSTSWRMGDTKAVLYGTLSSTAPIKGSVTVGFVIGDSANIKIGTSLFNHSQSVITAGSFRDTISVHDNIGYYYRAYIITGDTVFYGESRQFGYVMVDLGLKSGVKWANMNLGADIPEEYGYYYAWGETSPKDTYTTGNYAYGTQNIGEGYSIAGTTYDAAHVNLGNAWRMPTYAELKELVDSCDWEKVTQNNVNGYRVKSRKNGNSIFLPQGGFKINGNLSWENRGGSYPSATQVGDGNSNAYTLSWGNGFGIYGNDDYYPFEQRSMSRAGRYVGRTIRAVAAPNVTTPDGLAFNILTDSATWKPGESRAYLYGTFTTTTPLTEPLTVGFVIGDSSQIIRGKSRYEYTMQTQQACRITTDVEVYMDMGYWYKAFVVVGDSTYYGQARHFGLEMVNLGLPSGRLWANMNVGAGTPEQYGDYYAWAEVETKDTYTAGTYKYATTQNLSDDYDIAWTGMDAAHINMGGVWRMPSSDDLYELNNNCTWEWVLQNNVKGYRVTGPNGNSIFLPAAGFKETNNSPLYAGYGGSYFSSRQVGDGNVNAYTLSWKNGRDVYGNDDYYPFERRENTRAGRYFGRSVRAVAVPNVVLEDNAMLILTDSAHWQLNDTQATVYGTFANMRKLSAPITVGIIIGDSSNVTLNTATFTYSKETSDPCRLNTTVDVEYNMGYWYRAYALVDGHVYYGTAKHFGWEMVDLGLPSGTLWSNVNVGSAWPEDYGKYYAWGEVSEKDTYTRDNYQYYDNGSYMTIGSNGNIASTNYDVAYLTMGNAWRMPTVDELRELNNNCTWTWVLVNGIKGYRVTGPNGSSIFLPAAGFKETSSSPLYAGNGGSYFSSMQVSDGNVNAYTLSWKNGRDVYSNDDYYPFERRENTRAGRYFGRTIRPVAVRKRQ